MKGKRNIPYPTFIRRIRDRFALPRDNGGFSLIEIMVASAIASLIMVMVYTAYHSIVKTIQDVTSYSEFYENINMAITRIDSDIAGMYINPENTKIALVGEVSAENSSVNFVTINHRGFNVLGSLKKSVPRSDINEVGYYLREDPRYPGLYFLMRREEPGYNDDITTGGTGSVLLENVVQLKFEFKQRNDWTTSWDSRENKRFPQAIRTTLRVKTYTGREQDMVFLSYPELNG